jgi:hypothetical protein
MLSESKLAAYREMSVEERWHEVEQLMTFAWRFLKELPPEELERRLAYDQEQHDKSDAMVLEYLRRLP